MPLMFNDFILLCCINIIQIHVIPPGVMTINITTITAINIGVVGEVVVEVVSRNECVENVSTSEFRLVVGNKVGMTKA